MGRRCRGAFAEACFDHSSVGGYLAGENARVDVGAGLTQPAVGVGFRVANGCVRLTPLNLFYIYFFVVKQVCLQQIRSFPLLTDVLLIRLAGGIGFGGPIADLRDWHELGSFSLQPIERVGARIAMLRSIADIVSNAFRLFGLAVSTRLLNRRLAV
jgi:hypothetical protein